MQNIIKNSIYDMKIKMEKISHKINKLIFIFLSIYLLTRVFDNLSLIFVGTDEVILFKIIRYITYLYFLIKVLFDICLLTFDLKKVIPLLIISSLSVLFSRSLEGFVLVLICISFHDVEIKKIIKYFVFFHGIYLLLSFFLSSVGIIPNLIYDVGTRFRESLGFSWTTNGNDMFFFFICGLFAYKRENLGKEVYYLLSIIAILLFFLTDTKFTYLLTLVFISCIYLYRNHTIIYSIFIKILENKIIKALIIFLPFLLLIFSVILSMFYDQSNEAWSSLNSLLSNRLYLMNEGLKNFGITFFGSHIEWNSFGLNYASNVDYNFIDCSYLYILYNFGIIFACSICFLLSKLIVEVYNMNKTDLLLIIIFILGICFIEQRLINLIYCPIMLLSSFCLNSADNNSITK